MAWVLLLVAGVLEVVWAVGLKYTEGFMRPVASVVAPAAMAGSVVLLGLAMKSLPVGTSYAVWVGVGAVGTAILGMVLFEEPASAGRLVSLGLIVVQAARRAGLQAVEDRLCELGVARPPVHVERKGWNRWLLGRGGAGPARCAES